MKLLDLLVRSQSLARWRLAAVPVVHAHASLSGDRALGDPHAIAVLIAVLETHELTASSRSFLALQSRDREGGDHHAKAWLRRVEDGSAPAISPSNRTKILGIQARQDKTKSLIQKQYIDIFITAHVHYVLADSTPSPMKSYQVQQGSSLQPPEVL